MTHVGSGVCSAAMKAAEREPKKAFSDESSGCLDFPFGGFKATSKSFDHTL
jgi:hypothetical protein